MKVKRYVAVSVNEAVEKIRKELGSNAIILDTKKVRRGGFLGFFAEVRYEVIAAIDDPLQEGKGELIAMRDEKGGKKQGRNEISFEELFQRDVDLLLGSRQRENPLSSMGEITPSLRSPVSEGRPSRGKEKEGGEGEMSGQERKRSDDEGEGRRNGNKGERKRDGNAEDGTVTGNGKAQVAAERLKDGVVKENREEENESSREDEKGKRRSSAASRTKRGGRKSPFIDVNDPWQKQVLDEMKEMRSLIHSWVLKKSDPEALPEVYQPYFHHLIGQGVEEEIVIHLFTTLMESDSLPGDLEEAKRRIKTKLAEWVRPHIRDGIEPKTRLVQIFGPTGVGKTTTIAKLASEYSLKRKKKVAFLTSDTYRIAAIDQLKTYANILNIPMEVIFSPQDLSQSLKRLSHYELIFMDTAGRNYRDGRHIEEMELFLTRAIPTEIYLILSLNGKEKDSKDLVEEFLKLGIKDMILTKFDETSTYGTLLNLVYHYPITLSYIANGQSVPDDLFSLSTDRLVDLLMEGAKS